MVRDGGNKGMGGKGAGGGGQETREGSGGREIFGAGVIPKFVVFH